jgi:anaerobic selenocysteine-containing dehydrogenase
MHVRNVICHFCHTNCRLHAFVEDGKLVRLTGDRSDMVSRGYMCERAAVGPRWLYHPAQLMHPLKRAGRRGEGKWERVSWDQALDEIATRLGGLKEQFGPECLALLEGTYRNDIRCMRARFCNYFGNPHNVGDAGNVSYLAIKSMGQILAGGNVSPAGGITDCIVFWGMNVDDAWGFALDKMEPLMQARKSSSRVMPRLMEIPMKFLIKRPPLAQAIFKLLHVMPRTGRDPKAAKFKLMPRSPKVIVIDPRRTSAVDHADLWLRIRPGTDAALALGWLHVIISEKLFDAEFVDKWCYGFDQLATAVQEYTPEKVAQITGAPAEDIVAAARMYAAGRPSTLWYGMTPFQSGWNSTQLEHARLALVAVTGNLDVFGGNELLDFPEPLKQPGTFVSDPELEAADALPQEQRAKQLGADRFKLFTFPGWEMRNELFRRIAGGTLRQAYGLRSCPPVIVDAILTARPYPVKAAISWCSNALSSYPASQRVLQALTSDHMDLFVALDFWMTPTAALADYVLLVASWMERPFCGEALVGLHGVVAGERAVAPLGERRHDYDFWRGLACRLGQEEHWPWKTVEELHDYRLHRLGMTHADLVRKGGLKPYWRHYRKYRQRGFATSTGKVELYSQGLAALGYPPLPYYREGPETPVSAPEVAKEYPLILLAGTRFRPMYASEQRHFGIGLREHHPDPLVQIHPATAAQHGIQEGDWVWIETRRGRIRQRARITDVVPEYLVSCEHGWWYPEKPAEAPSLFGAFDADVNMLTLDDLDKCDQVSGGWTNHGLLCRIRKAD